MPFFRNWLIEKGVHVIIDTFSDSDELLQRKKEEEKARVSSEDIVNLSKKWGVYKGQSITEDKVRAWLEQFGNNNNQRLMFRILQNVSFYTADNIRSKMKEAHGIVIRGMMRYIKEGKLKKFDDILVSYLDHVGKSGASYAKLYADENNIYYENIVVREKLAEALTKKQGLNALVFIDDFIGTGDSASIYFEELAKECKEIFQRNGLRIFFIAVCGFQESLTRIEDALAKLGLPVEVHICDSLEESAKAFTDKSLIFPNEAERIKARSICYDHGISLAKNNPLGYGECQATIVFENSCPDNTLPIIWTDVKDWIPLFPR